MLIQVHKTRRCNSLVYLTRQAGTVDDFGHVALGEPEVVLSLYAEVQQMSSNKTMLTFQLADVVGLDIYFRKPEAEFDGLLWHGHTVVVSSIQDVDNRGRWLHVQGYYQQDAL